MSLNEEQRQRINTVINVQSARRILSSTQSAMESLPNLRLATIFAEQVPELHSLKLAMLAKQSNVLIVSPASVGVLIPGILKLGAIGGTRYPQLAVAGIFKRGNTAVISTSGGMVNELIHTGTARGSAFLLPWLLGEIVTLSLHRQILFLLAQDDPATEQIVYFGELGGGMNMNLPNL